ncbi:glycerophosphodiester phosphodiesterase family protein [Gramella sp. MAR_2010_147]|uniref:glycerophosphodiester phosphodiesterase family protein n=1 Tax=Gramella sp. MAR_2010_147 TaxID=1250205 RepID=UPI00087CB6AC|nr:glycerophosphodiester phosphodiesterase family protein [Gramella sp. MAR_2010_147]SDR75891.1 glycerophosphoryl diester phosphodiesterase [Gramella sp. MAR_2010_147]
MPRKVKIYSAFAIVAILIACLALWNPLRLKPASNDLYKAEDIILVAAHRGSHKNLPENSFSSINESIRNEIDIVEVDVRKTKDQKFIILHDEKLDRTTTGTGLAHKKSYAEIKRFQLKFDNKATNEKVPGLREVLQRSKGKIIINLDCKFDDIASLKKVVKIISEYQMESSVLLNISDLKLIPVIHKYNPDIRMMPVVQRERKIKQLINYQYIKIVQVPNQSYSEKLLEELDNNDISIWVNSLKKYDKLESEGKNGFEKLIKIKKVAVIQTDHPEDLLIFLRKKGLHP